MRSRREAMMLKTKSVIKDNNSVLIPEGIYTLKFIQHETTQLWGKKVILSFEVVDVSDYYGVEMKRYYNIDNFIGPQKVGGAFDAGKGSAYVKEYMDIFPDTRDIAEINIDNFKGKTVLGKVSTVKSDHRKQSIHECLQYSRIERLIELVDAPKESDPDFEDDDEDFDEEDWDEEIDD